MKRLLPLVTALCCLSLMTPTVRPGHPAPPPDTASFSVPPGEELLYEVSWWIVKLGTIRLRVVDTVAAAAGPGAAVRADIDSYETLPFASLHSVSETVMDGECYSLSSLALTQEGNEWRSVRYERAPGLRRLFVERGTVPGRDKREVAVGSVDTLEIDGRFQDGLSIFYFARAHLLDPGGMTVPTIVEGKPGRTVFRYPGERTSEEIDAVDYPVDVIGFEGVAEFRGIYGLNGDFQGWFSNDAARVPIRATMGLMIGPVKIELISWKRDGWNPPRSPED